MILVLHNVTSTQRLVDTARLAFQNDVMFVVTKAGGNSRSGRRSGGVETSL